MTNMTTTAINIIFIIYFKNFQALAWESKQEQFVRNKNVANTKQSVKLLQ